MSDQPGTYRGGQSEVGEPDTFTIPEPSPREAEFLTQIRKDTRKRVESVLTARWNAFGAMDREELGAMLDGAQDATMNWMPPTKKKSG